MEFDRSRVYTALNADEVKPGSKVFVADSLAALKLKVKENGELIEGLVLNEHINNGWTWFYRNKFSY